LNKHLFNIIFLVLGLAVCFFLGNSAPLYCWGLVVVVFLTFLFCGVFEIRFNYFIISQNKVSSDKIILSFDDGPNSATREIMGVLKKHNVGAVFFLVGVNIEAEGEIFKELAKDGYVLGNHSYSHSNKFALMSSLKILEELEKTEGLLRGHTKKLFRPPFGITSPPMRRAIKKSGLKSIGWSLRSLDTLIVDNNKLIGKVLRKAQGGDILLLHDEGICTAACLDEMIIRLKSSGKSLANNEDIVRLLHV
jgi:peptidoglycan/xylan/chitin deacetylase (PgdA/CDA1 family)